MPPNTVHFNGSVNLADAETVMREISTRIPTGVRRMTDGETGERGYWIHYQIEKFLQMPEFEPVASAWPTRPSATRRRCRSCAWPRAPPRRPIEWPNLGYADEYAASFEIFDRLQGDGTIPADVRFQLQYPTPLASMAGTFAPEDLAAIAAVLRGGAVRRPRQRCSRGCRTTASRCSGTSPSSSACSRARWARLGDAAGAGRRPGSCAASSRCPADVPVGFHLCYGDYGHQHFKQPESLQMQVDVVNAVNAAASRPLAWASFTVPAGAAPTPTTSRRSATWRRPGDRAVLRARPLPPGRSGRRHDGHAGRAHRRCARSAAGSGASAPSAGWAGSTPSDVPRLLDIHREILAA